MSGRCQITTLSQPIPQIGRHLDELAQEFTTCALISNESAGHAAILAGAIDAVGRLDLSSLNAVIQTLTKWSSSPSVQAAFSDQERKSVQHKLALVQHQGPLIFNIFNDSAFLLAIGKILSIVIDAVKQNLTIEPKASDPMFPILICASHLLSISMDVIVINGARKQMCRVSAGFQNAPMIHLLVIDGVWVNLFPRAFDMIDQYILQSSAVPTILRNQFQSYPFSEEANIPTPKSMQLATKYGGVLYLGNATKGINLQLFVIPGQSAASVQASVSSPGSPVETDSDEICVYCRRQPNSLPLSCGHNLCLDCMKAIVTEQTSGRIVLNENEKAAGEYVHCPLCPNIIHTSFFEFCFDPAEWQLYEEEAKRRSLTAPQTCMTCTTPSTAPFVMRTPCGRALCEPCIIAQLRRRNYSCMVCGAEDHACIQHISQKRVICGSCNIAKSIVTDFCDLACDKGHEKCISCVNLNSSCKICFPERSPKPSMAESMNQDGEVSQIQIEPMNSHPDSLLNCSLCMCDYPKTEIGFLPCGHYYCQYCLGDYCHTSIQDQKHTFFTGNVLIRQSGISCPEMQPKCNGTIEGSMLERVLANFPGDFDKYTEIMIEKISNLVRCPYQNCGQKYVIEGASAQSFECPFCRGLICGECSQQNHQGMSCRGSYFRNLSQIANQNGLIIAQCPECKVPVEKEEEKQCNHMTCAHKTCKTEFCYQCSSFRSPITAHGNHYHRPQCIDYRPFHGNDVFSRECEKCMVKGKLCERPKDLKVQRMFTEDDEV